MSETYSRKDYITPQWLHDISIQRPLLSIAFLLVRKYINSKRELEYLVISIVSTDIVLYLPHQSITDIIERIISIKRDW